MLCSWLYEAKDSIHSVTKGHYFSKNPFKKNLQIEIFYTKMVQDTQKRQASIFDSLF